MSTLEDEYEGDQETKVRQYAKECFERTMHLARAGSAPKAIADGAAFVHDVWRIAREIAESVYGSAWEPHCVEVYDRLAQRIDEEPEER